MKTKCQSDNPATCRFHGTPAAPVETQLDAAVRNNDFAAYEQARKNGTPPTSENILNSITSDPAAFEVFDQEPEPYTEGPEEQEISGWKVPYIIQEFSVRTIKLDEYQTRVAVFDEDRLPIVTADIDVYDDQEAAVETLAFVAHVMPSNYYHNRISASKVRAIAQAYPAFKDSTPPQPSVNENTDEVGLTSYLVGRADSGTPSDEMMTYLNRPETRKNKGKYTHPFADVDPTAALAVAEAYRNA